jgi:hypothetical protein
VVRAKREAVLWRLAEVDDALSLPLFEGQV